MRPLWRAGCSGPAGASRLVKDVVVAVPLGVHDDAALLELNERLFNDEAGKLMIFDEA